MIDSTIGQWANDLARKSHGIDANDKKTAKQDAKKIKAGLRDAALNVINGKTADQKTISDLKTAISQPAKTVNPNLFAKILRLVHLTQLIKGIKNQFGRMSSKKFLQELEKKYYPDPKVQAIKTQINESQKNDKEGEAINTQINQSQTQAQTPLPKNAKEFDAYLANCKKGVVVDSITLGAALDILRNGISRRLQTENGRCDFDFYEISVENNSWQIGLDTKNTNYLSALNPNEKKTAAEIFAAYIFSQFHDKIESTQVIDEKIQIKWNGQIKKA